MKEFEINNFSDFQKLDLKKVLSRGLFFSIFLTTVDAVSGKELKPKLELTSGVSIKVGKQTVKTTIGRYVFNRFVLPDNMYENGFINSVIDKKGFWRVGSLLSDAKTDNLITEEEFADSIDRLNWLSATIGSVLGGGLTEDSLYLSDKGEKDVAEIVDGLSDDITNEELAKLDKQVVKVIKKDLSNSDLHEIVDSGAKGSYANNMKNIYGYRGKLDGNMIKGNLSDTTFDEYSKVNSLEGSYGRAKMTAVGGYASKLVGSSLSHTKVDTKRNDCGSTLFLTLTLENPDDFMFRNVRLATSSGAFTPLTKENLEKYDGKVIHLRSPMFCKGANGYCVKCYGESWKINKITRNLASLVFLVTSHLTNASMKSMHDLSVKYGTFNFNKLKG